MFGRQAHAVPSACRICGAPALYSYFGLIVCQSCKMFFKRNAEKDPVKITFFFSMKQQCKIFIFQAILRCDLDGHCSIIGLSRRVCAACRLEKCLAMGMRVDMIRGFRSRKNKKRKPRKHPENIRNWSLVQSDRCDFSETQWTLLSNLLNCYDEHSGFVDAQRFVAEQNNLPVKFRYKAGPVGDFLTSILNRAQGLFEKNRDFHSLCLGDQSILLRTATMHVASLSVHVILRPAQLMEHPGFYKSHEILFGTDATIFAERLYGQLDPDPVVMKLILAVMAFSTLTYAFYSNSKAENLTNIKQVLRIQDSYIDLLWRYLNFKYSFVQAVLRLNHLMRCIFSIHQALAKAVEVQWYNRVVDNIIEQTEHSLSCV